MIDWTKPIETTEGFPARVISDNYRTARYSGCVLRVVQVDFKEYSVVWYVDNDGSHPNAGKLIRNRKTKREGWINIFPDRWVGPTYESKEAALRHPNAKGALDTIKIEWEE
jgi:hypothetical protein